MTASRGLMAGARVITHGHQLRGQCDGTTANGSRMATHVGPNALLRTSAYPNVAAAPGSGPLLSPAVPAAGYWTLNGSAEFAAGGLCTAWAGSPASAAAAPAYTWGNSPSGNGGIVPSGGMVIDGFTVPAGSYVFQFMDLSAGVGMAAGPGAPGLVFRGCRARTGMPAPGMLNCSGFTSGIWLLYCDTGGAGPGAGCAQEAFDIESASGVTCYRSYFSYAGVLCEPNLATGTMDVIECYLEKLTHIAGKHLDGISFPGGQANFRILRNWSVHVTPDENGAAVQDTGAVYISNLYGGSVTEPLPGTGTNPDGTAGYQVLGNWCGGTGYCFYAGQATSTGTSAVANMTFAGNRVTTAVYSTGGFDGPAAGEPDWGSYGNTQSGNLWADGPDAGTPFL